MPGTRSEWSRGEAYEPFMGRWSRRLAAKFLDWLGTSPGSRWLDTGCGTGALSQAILQFASPGEVLGIDPSPDYLAFARHTIQDPHAKFMVGEAQTLSVKTGEYDAAVSGLALNFIPQPEQAVQEMARVVRAGGVVGVYVWDYAGKMQMLRYFWDVAAALDPAARELDEGRRFPICNLEPLVGLFRGAGLGKVEAAALEVDTEFKDFEDYWAPFLGGQGPAPGYVQALSKERREALRERLRAGLPFASGGSIPLTARAWGVRGEAGK